MFCSVSQRSLLLWTSLHCLRTGRKSRPLYAHLSLEPSHESMFVLVLLQQVTANHLNSCSLSVKQEVKVVLLSAAAILWCWGSAVKLNIGGNI